MKRRRIPPILAVALLSAFPLLLAGISCRPLTEYQPPGSLTGSLLKNPIPDDAVTFDILIVHVPHQDREILDRFWLDVDEQELAPKVRSELNSSGFRAGILGATIPESLSSLMAIKGRSLRQSVEEEVEMKADTSAPKTLSKIETLSPGNRCLIPTRDAKIDQIPVLSFERGELSGRTYRDAMTSLSIGIRPVGDGSVEFEITPFLTFGQPQEVTKYKYGQMVHSIEQPTKTFDNLRTTLPLRPGQFLVFGPSHRKVEGLGHYFFTQGIGDYDQKIVVVRLLFTQHDRRFHQFSGFQEIFDQQAPASKTKNASLAADFSTPSTGSELAKTPDFGDEAKPEDVTDDSLSAAPGKASNTVISDAKKRSGGGFLDIFKKKE